MSASADKKWREDRDGLGWVVDRYRGSTPPTDTSHVLALALEEPQSGVAKLSTAQQRAKRVLDLLGVFVLAICTAPVLLLAMLAVRITSRGPIFYAQTRVGVNERCTALDRRCRSVGPPEGVADRRVARFDRRASQQRGRIFRLYKLRTMSMDAESNGAQLAEKNDQRVTPVGRFLRLSRIDELPQLWNVIEEHMSLVGPRPERPEFIEELQSEIPEYVDRLAIKPGITGLAQVLNGYDTTIASVRAKIHFDLIYLQNYSLWYDVKILFRTVAVVLTGRGAR